MKTIGITGGIGSGKSTVSDYLKKKGYTVLDADEISRALTGPNGPALEPILLEFGASVFDESGCLNRKKLADIVFVDNDKLRKLEKITTDCVIEEIKEQMRHLKEAGFDGILFVDAPLIFEFNLQSLFDETWLVTAGTETRISRVVLRDAISREEVRKRIESQMPESEKEKLADFIINNSLKKDWLIEQVDRLLYRLEPVNA